VSYRDGLRRCLARGVRVRFVRACVVSHATDKTILRVLISPDTLGTVVSVLPFFTVRLDEPYQGKIEAVQWHQSARVFEDLAPVSGDLPALWIVK